MKVVTVKTLEGKIRYYLNDDEGNPIQPVMKYLRFKDNSKIAPQIKQRLAAVAGVKVA